MKKSLIALAALSAFAATAQAQSSVQVYGVMDIGYGETKNKVSGSDVAAENGARKTTTTGNGDGGLATSRLGVQGSEDLGGGLKANFRLEYDLVDVGAGGTNATGGFGARESWVSLQDAKLGEVKLGRQITASHAAMSGFLAGYANNTVGSVYSAGTGASTSTMPNESSIRPYNVFANRVVGYTSPNMSGLVIMAQYGENALDTVKTDDTNTKLKFADISARFTSGKLALGASFQQQKSTANSFDAAAIDTAGNIGTGTSPSAAFSSPAGKPINTGAGNINYETTMFGASYNLGVVQPFVLYSERENKYSTKTANSVNSLNSAGAVEVSSTGASMSGNFKVKVTEAGLRAPIGAKTVLFASMYDGDAKASDYKADLKGYQVGALYNLSKRTTAYAITGEQEAKEAGYKNKTTGVSAGLRHSF